MKRELCKCGHNYDEHADGAECANPNCACNLYDETSRRVTVWIAGATTKEQYHELLALLGKLSIVKQISLD